MFPDFESFCQVMDQCTENYECLVIDNNAKSNKLVDQVYWYKAAPHPDFKIGSQELWAHSAANSKPDEDAAEDFDGRFGANGKKAKAAIIQVRKY